MINKDSQTDLKEINRKKTLENTLYYLKNYLNPDEKWDRRITPKERINKIRYAEVYWETVSDHIKDMDYQNFLKTPYWKAIAAHTKYRAGYRCQLCNSARDLVAHHRSYIIHGREHAHMQELIVLCDDCHSKFHDKVSRSKRKKNKSLQILIFYISLFILFVCGGLERERDIQIQEKKDAEVRRVHEIQRLEAETKKRAKQVKKNKKMKSLKEARYRRQKRHEKFFNGIRDAWNKLKS